jgi:phosphonopyruvate decarboxylase
LFEIRKRAGLVKSDFLTVGSMGHASSIALGIALAQSDRRVVCLDGDGAALMHLGALAIIGSRAGSNFLHIILNNGAHESVGGQPTAGFKIDFCGIAQACGYASASSVSAKEDISHAVRAAAAGPQLVEIRVGMEARSDLGRPTLSPSENKRKFMQELTAHEPEYIS